MLRKLLIVAVALVLFFLLWVPLAVFIYGFSILLGGLVLLTPLVILQVLTLKAMQRASGRAEPTSTPPPRHPASKPDQSPRRDA